MVAWKNARHEHEAAGLLGDTCLYADQESGMHKQNAQVKVGGPGRV